MALMVIPVYHLLNNQYPLFKCFDEDQRSNPIYLLFDRFRWEKMRISLENTVPDAFPPKAEEFHRLVQDYLKILRSRVQKVDDFLCVLSGFTGGLTASIFFQQYFFLHVAGIVCMIASVFFYRVYSTKHTFVPRLPDHFLNGLKMELSNLPPELLKENWPNFNQKIKENVSRLLTILPTVKNMNIVIRGPSLLKIGKNLKGLDAFGILHHIFSDDALVKKWKVIMQYAFEAELQKQDGDTQDDRTDFEKDDFIQQIKGKEDLTKSDQFNLFRHVSSKYKMKGKSSILLSAVFVYVIKTINGLENRKKECAGSKNKKVTDHVDKFCFLLKNKGYSINEDDEKHIEGFFTEGDWMGFIRYLSKLEKDA